jgi:hypothetical protein
MAYHELNNGAAHDVRSNSELTCPLCGEGYLIRIHRRVIDRLLSLFMPVYRFRCLCFSCQWEGNIRVNSRPGRRVIELSALFARIQRTWSTSRLFGKNSRTF